MRDTALMQQQLATDIERECTQTHTQQLRTHPRMHNNYIRAPTHAQQLHMHPHMHVHVHVLRHMYTGAESCFTSLDFAGAPPVKASNVSCGWNPTLAWDKILRRREVNMRACMAMHMHMGMCMYTCESETAACTRKCTCQCTCTFTF